MRSVRVRQIPIEEFQYRGIGMAAIVLADQAMFRTWVDHHFEWLFQILQPAKELGAVEEQHIVIGHSVHHQQASAQ
jgi:hypothetical protein